MKKGDNLIKNKKPPGKCIFCGDGKLSKEHFWPEWASPLLPKYQENKHVEKFCTFTEKTKLVKPPEVRSRQGPSWTKTIRAVCRVCNNGWMSALENTAKPILISLIATQPHTITIDSMRILAQWICLKVMVGEQNHPEEAVNLAADRTRFRATLEIPQDFGIWIAKCGVEGWKSRYVRNSATISRGPIVMPHHRFKNAHSVAFGIGDLFVFALQATVRGVIDLHPKCSEAVIQIYPAVRPIVWPPPRGLSADEVRRIAETFRDDLRSPEVYWARGFPT